jgi:glycosyl hydrolase family 25
MRESYFVGPKSPRKNEVQKPSHQSRRRGCTFEELGPGKGSDMAWECGSTSNTRGIDVSSDQESQIGTNSYWQTLRTNNDIKFGFIKATEGTSYTNPYLPAAWSACNAINGLDFTYLYHFVDNALATSLATSGSEKLKNWLIGFWRGELHLTTIDPSTRQFGFPA